MKTKSCSFLRKGASLMFVVIVGMVAFPSPAMAYIDPGTGSFILQMLLAGLFTLLFMLRQFRQKVKSFFLSLFGSKKDKK